MCLPYSVDELHKTVDELQKSHRSLETTKEALVKSEKLASMGQLAAGIAHEVNNPLGILLLHANLLLEDCESDPAVSADVKLIVDQANRCKKIISGLLNFARQSRVVRQPTDLTDLVAEVMRTIPDRRGHLRRSRRPPRRPGRRARRRSDRPGAHQPAHQRPARDARRRRDHGLLSTATEETIVIAVEDEGTGIPKENLDKLFSPFFTTKQVGKGTGLGLAVTHGIVKMHRGQITVESNADPEAGPTGTTFTISLPRLESATDVAASLQAITGS